MRNGFIPIDTPVPAYSTKEMEYLNNWKNKFGELSAREWPDGNVIHDGIRSTYPKKMEFISDQAGFTMITDKDIDFHNTGIFNFDNDNVNSWDRYCLNFD